MAKASKEIDEAKSVYVVAHRPDLTDLSDAESANIGDTNDVLGKEILTVAGNVNASENKAKYVVAHSPHFMDIQDSTKLWKPGDDVSHFDKDRLDKLIELGYVEKH